MANPFIKPVILPISDVYTIWIRDKCYDLNTNTLFPDKPRVFEITIEHHDLGKLKLDNVKPDEVFYTFGKHLTIFRGHVFANGKMCATTHFPSTIDFQDKIYKFNADKSVTVEINNDYYYTICDRNLEYLQKNFPGKNHEPSYKQEDREKNKLIKSFLELDEIKISQLIDKYYYNY